MTTDDFQKNFPAGTKIPPALEKLRAFDDRAGDFYSGRFELCTDGVDRTHHWFAEDKDAARQFVLFGHTGGDSTIGYWLYKGRTLENAPIVLLDGEGGGMVLADSVEQFLSLLAVGADRIGLLPSKDDPPMRALPKFQAWLKKEFNILPPARPGEVIFDAHGNHPSLGKWIDEWQAKQAGK